MRALGKCFVCAFTSADAYDRVVIVKNAHIFVLLKNFQHYMPTQMERLIYRALAADLISRSRAPLQLGWEMEKIYIGTEP